jgi:hypothetical protein
LLYGLLDDAEKEQRFLDASLIVQWHALRCHFDPARPERTHAALVALFEKLERTEVFTGTWIESRWLKAKSQRKRTRTRTGRARCGRVTHK